MSWGGGGVATKNPVPDLKFAVAFVFSRYIVVLSGFFGLNFDKKFQLFKNHHVNNEVLRGQELHNINNTSNAYRAQQKSY